MNVNIHEAKSTLSKLVAAIEDEGSQFQICRAGRPVALLTPLPPKKPVQNTKKDRIIGLLSGKIWANSEFSGENDLKNAVFGIKGE